MQNPSRRIRIQNTMAVIQANSSLVPKSPALGHIEDSDGSAIRTTGPIATDDTGSKTEGYVDEVDSLPVNNKIRSPVVAQIEDNDGSAIRTMDPKDYADDSKTEDFVEVDTLPQSNSVLENERAIRTARPETAKNVSRTEKIIDEHDNTFRKDNQAAIPKMQLKVIIDTPEQSAASEPTEIAIRTDPPTGYNLNASKTELQIEPTEGNSNAIRTQCPHDSEAALMKTELLLDTHDDKPEPSFVSCESGNNDIRTERLCNSKEDFSRTQCQLNSRDDLPEVKMMENTLAPIKNEIQQQKVVTLLKSNCFGTTTYQSMKPMSQSQQNKAQGWIPTFTEMYDVFWTNRNSLFKITLIIWLTFSTMLIVKGLVSFINTFWSVSVDDCESAKSFCDRFGFACFSSCGASRFNTFWYRVFGE